MKVLLDTCVLSEIRRSQGKQIVKDTVASLPDEDIFLSAITIGEIIKGITLLKDSKQKALLEAWIEGLERHYRDRILPFDAETSRIWGELTATAQRNGQIVASADGQITATAKQHGLYVMTRNVKDFEPTGAMLVNPWE